MSVSLEEMTAWRVRLLEARFNGIREVRDANGETVSYRSDRELGAALAALDYEIRQRTGPATSRTIRFSTSKGTC